MFGNDNMFGAGGVSTGFYDTTIDQSLRFNDADSAYLSWTPASAGNRKTWTFSTWVKRGNLTTRSSIFQVNSTSTGTGGFGVEWYNADEIMIWVDDGTYTIGMQTSAKFRDPSAWYHLVLRLDTTDATSSNRVKIYINGEETAYTFTYGSALPQNAETFVNSSRQHNIGIRQRATTTLDLPLDGYLAETHFIDGTALDASSFGEFKSGVWIPKAYSGSYGTNGFHLEFANSGSLGADTSGNGNTWSAYNLASTDQMLDSPTNNFPALNTLNKGTNQTTSQGNTYWYSASNYQGAITATMAFPSSGKWYVEGRAGPGTYNAHTMGFATDKLADFNHYLGYTVDGWAYDGYNGNIYHNNSSSGYGSSYGDGAIVSMLFDADAGTVTWWLNGTSQGTGVTGLDTTGATTYLPAWGDSYTNGAQQWWVNFGQDGSFAGMTTTGGYSDDNGIGDFKYQPPAGYLALCTANLPEPAISPLDDASPSDHFNTVLYTGDGGTQSVSVGFQPDLSWVKVRNTTYSHSVYDSVRGTSVGYLMTDGTSAEQTTHGVVTFDADGFDASAGSTTILHVNESGRPYVAWNWKANGSGVSNTNGSSSSVVSANTDAGFSIVTYNGTGSAATVGHGLTQAPDMIIFKKRNTAVTPGADWSTYHSSVGATKSTKLNLTNTPETNSVYFNNTEPTSSVFSVGSTNDTNISGGTYVAYCFHSVEGYSKFGSYTGNGSTDGPFVYTGFRPAFVMTKMTSSAGHWRIHDEARSIYNPMNEILYANGNDAELVDNDIDFTANGFKLRNNLAQENASGATMIYIAFAEDPFKYANAR